MTTITAYHQTVRGIIENIKPLDELERDHKEDALEWIDSGVELCRLEKPAVPPKHLVSYFVLLDPERNKLLLVDHKKSGLWLPSGGHVDPGEHPQATAHRELQEELFVNLPLWSDEPLFVTVTETVGSTAGHVDVSLWYVFLADSTEQLSFDANEFHGIQWFPISQIPTARIEPHMSRFCKKLKGPKPPFATSKGYKY